MILARSYSAIMPWTWSSRSCLGAAAEGVAQEDDLDAATGEFLEDQDLIGILAREPIRVEDVEAVDGPGGGLVPEPLEARAGQDAPADAVVDEAQLGVAFQGVARDALRDRLELAGDRVLLGLLFAGDPGVDRHTEIVIGHGWSSSPGLGSEALDRRRGRLVVDRIEIAAVPGGGRRPGSRRDMQVRSIDPEAE